jgi:hypothetical protein
MKKHLKKSLSILFICFFVAFSSVIAGAVHAQQIEVELEVGPEMTGSDHDRVLACFDGFADRFPFDAVAFEPPNSGTVCPKFEVTEWDLSYEFCWVIDVFNLLEPAILIGMMWQAIINL